jgi:hypothetical protein
LQSHTKVASEIKFDASSDSEGKTSEVAACAATDVGCTSAADYKWPSPLRPLFQNVLVGEIALELVQYRLLTGRSATSQMDIAVLSCPPEFDQVLFIEAHTG